MTRRQEKVASLIKRELADILIRKVSDPRVRGVHIVNVDISPDFHLARVSYSTLEVTQDQEKTQRGLDSAKSFLRRELNRVLQLRTLPELAFHFDPSIRHGDTILDLLKNLDPKD